MTRPPFVRRLGMAFCAFAAVAFVAPLVAILAPFAAAAFVWNETDI